MTLLFRVIASSVFFVFLAQVFPVFYFPGTCGLGALRFYGKKSEVYFFYGVLSLLIFFIPSQVMAVFAAAAALSGFLAGGFLRSARKYFAVFLGFFFTLLTAWLLFYMFSEREIVSVFFSKTSRILLYTFAGQGELAPGKEIRTLAFRVVQIIPAIIFILAVIGFFLNAYIIKFLLKGEKNLSTGVRVRSLPDRESLPGRVQSIDLFQKKAAIIPVPIYLLIIAIIGEIFLKNPLGRYISGNVLVISVFFFFIEGMEIFRFILAKLDIPAFLRIFFMIFLVFMYPVPAITGILDVWVDFKRRIGSEGGIK